MNAKKIQCYFGSRYLSLLTPADKVSWLNRLLLITKQIKMGTLSEKNKVTATNLGLALRMVGIIFDTKTIDKTLL